MTETTNYKLKKPGASDNAQVDVLNGNMDVIDRELKLRATLGQDGKVDAGQLPEMDVSQTLAQAELKNTPADDDGVLVTDSAAENVPKRVLWSRIKAALKGYFDPLYAAKSHTHAWGTVTGKPETFPRRRTSTARRTSARGRWADRFRPMPARPRRWGRPRCGISGRGRRI